jgi:hypothetical protein
VNRPALLNALLNARLNALFLFGMTAAALGVGGIVACAASSERPSPLCTCEAEELFNGTSCVPAADFEAPAECSDEGAAVCGCDGRNYTSTCAATSAGVQVAYGGSCRVTTGGGGGGGGFGW